MAIAPVTCFPPARTYQKTARISHSAQQAPKTPQEPPRINPRCCVMLRSADRTYRSRERERMICPNEPKQKTTFRQEGIMKTVSKFLLPQAVISAFFTPGALREATIYPRT